MLLKIFYRLILVMTLSIASVSVNANIYVDPNWPVDTSGIELRSWGSGESYSLSIRHQPFPHHNTGIVFDYYPNSQVTRFGRPLTVPTASLTLRDMTADVGADLYVVNQGDEFSSNSILTGQFLNLNLGYSGFNTPYYMPDFRTNYRGNYSRSGTFFLGINTGQNIFPPVLVNGFYTSDRSIYGWAQFEYDATGINLISSALTYNQGGIIVGTLNTVPVPEAYTSAMILTGLGVIGFMARRRKNTQA